MEEHSQADGESPLFLYVSFNAAHTPLQGPNDYTTCLCTADGVTVPQKSFAKKQHIYKSFLWNSNAMYCTLAVCVIIAPGRARVAEQVLPHSASLAETGALFSTDIRFWSTNGNHIDSSCIIGKMWPKNDSKALLSNF